MGDRFQLKVKVFGLGSNGGRETQDKTNAVWCCSGGQEWAQGAPYPSKGLAHLHERQLLAKGCQCPQTFGT